MAFRVFLLWTFVLIARPQDLFLSIQPLRPALLLAVLTVLLIIPETTGKKLSSLLGTGMAKRFALFYLVMVIGIPFAFHRGHAFEYVFIDYLSNLIFFCALILQVDSLKRLKSLLLLVAFSAFFYSFFSLMYGTFSQGRFLIFGSMFDPNDIAYVLISLFPFSFFYLTSNEGPARKLLAVSSIAGSVIIILLSGSRGGIVSLGLVILLTLMSNITGIRKSYKVVFIAAVALSVFSFSDRINLDRYLTLTEIGEDYNVKAEFGRVQIWEDALELMKMNPLTGVGVNCFPMAIGEYRASLNLPPKWQAPHNSYIEVAAETGVAGFLLFLSLIYGCLRNFSYCKRAKVPAKGKPDIKVIATFLQIGFIGQLVAAFFLTQGYSIFFVLFFATSVVLIRLWNAQEMIIEPKKLS